MVVLDGFDCTNNIVLADVDLSDLLFLHSNQRKRFHSGFVVADSQLSIGILAPDPGLSGIRNCVAVLVADIDADELLGYLSEFSRFIKDLLAVFAPGVESSILSDSDKIISCRYVFEFHLKRGASRLVRFGFLAEIEFSLGSQKIVGGYTRSNFYDCFSF